MASILMTMKTPEELEKENEQLKQQLDDLDVKFQNLVIRYEKVKGELISKNTVLTDFVLRAELFGKRQAGPHMTATFWKQWLDDLHEARLQKVLP